MIDNIWYYWSKALGDKALPHSHSESDKVALIRSGIVLVYIVTNLILIVNVVHHW